MSQPTIPCPNCKGSGVVPDRKAQGREMKRRRNAARVTLREVSELTGLSIGYLSDMEHGRKGWTPRKINFYMAAIETVKQERAR